MNLVTALYLAFPVLSLALFLRLPTRTAVGLVYLTGLFWLPPVDYSGVRPGEFPYWIVGSAVPSDLLVNRAWIAPVTALVGSLIFARRAWAEFRPRPLDIAMACWCLWPILQWPFASPARPAGWLSSVYLIGVWGVPWLLGRIHCREAAEIWRLLKIFVLVTLSAAIFALVEGLSGPGLYNFLIQPHPFIADGAERYVGWRPLLFFENGNQYGIWICCAALAAWAIARSHEKEAFRQQWLIVAGIITFLAVFAQSVGALLLATLGTALFFSRTLRRVAGRAALPLLIGGALFGGVYASGIIPVRSWVESSAIGQQSLEAVRATGRGSFAWRVSQDQRVAPLVAEAPVVGAGRWDWWRPANTRPWGLAMLMLGQFGLIGLLLALTPLCGALITSMIQPTRDETLRRARLILSLLVLIAMADALLNSFIFLPAIALAGGLADKPVGKRRRRGRQSSSASD